MNAYYEHLRMVHHVMVKFLRVDCIILNKCLESFTNLCALLMVICKYTSRIWSVAESKVWCIRTADSDVCRLCVALCTRGRGLETSVIAMHFWKSGFKFAFGRNKKGKVFGILNRLRKQ